MSLAVGSRLGPYQIASPLGAGGMGEVYRATDTRLNRTVAIKVLPAALARDSERLRRFEQEARAISALDHPHICALYDVGDQDGTSFLVMQYVEGETLAARLERGRLALGEALASAAQILDALDAAHRAGIVHRDLKPANIMLTKSGAKLLDFGLAKAAPSVGPGAGASEVATAVPAQTLQGMIVGTLQYMAPEQLEGLATDARTDIFAFGATLFEMVTGRKAFSGATQASLIAAILTAPMQSMTEDVGVPALDWIAQRCLAKNPDDRWQTARDLRATLIRVEQAEAARAPLPARRTARAERLLWMLGGLAAGAALAALALVGGRQPLRDRSASVRFQINPPPGAAFESLPIEPQPAVSPDGRRIAFVATTPETSRALWVRDVDSTVAKAIPDTANVFGPFWSADSQQIAFVSTGRLARVRLSGGPPEYVCDAGDSFGGTWNQQGDILFAPRAGAGIFRVPASGGEPVPLTTIEPARQETSHRFPSFLPDGVHYVFLVRSDSAQHRGIYLGALGSPERKRLVDAESKPMYVEPGYILYVRGTTLIAHAFDARTFELAGEPIPLAEDVRVAPTNRGAPFAAMEKLLVYRGGFNTPPSQLVWVGRDGRQLATVGEPGLYRSFAVSPDGRRIVVEMMSRSGERSSLWLIDAATGSSSRLTFEEAFDGFPVWQPDGQQIVFASTRSGVWNMYTKRVSGSAREELLVKDSQLNYPRAVSPDGRFVFYDRGDPATGTDVWMMPLNGERKPKAVLSSTSNEAYSRLSPDGRWIAYTSDESHTTEVYVQPVSPTGSKWRISRNGGIEPEWGPDGNELFYLSAQGRLMAVPIRRGPAFEAGSPVPLFPIDEPAVASSRDRTYAAADNGRRFLQLKPAGVREPPSLTVVANWTAALRK